MQRVSKLIVPTDGPCKGHPCDNCRICRRGRCCRRDNPHYKLPKEGSWVGRVYGQLGQFAEHGDRVQCHICGDFSKSVGLHVYCHDVTPKEYRAYFGLNSTRPLCSTGLSQTLREVTSEKLRNYTGRLKGCHALSPEQKSSILKGVPRRSEARRQQKERVGFPKTREVLEPYNGMVNKTGIPNMHPRKGKFAAIYWNGEKQVWTKSYATAQEAQDALVSAYKSLLVARK